MVVGDLLKITKNKENEMKTKTKIAMVKEQMIKGSTAKKFILVLILLLPFLFALDFVKGWKKATSQLLPVPVTWEERVERLEPRVKLLEKKIDYLTDLVLALYEDANTPDVVLKEEKAPPSLTLEEKKKRLEEVKKKVAAKREQRLRKIEDRKREKQEALKKTREWQKDVWKYAPKRRR